MAAGSVMTSQVMAGVPTTTCGELAATNGLIGIRLQLWSARDVQAWQREGRRAQEANVEDCAGFDVARGRLVYDRARPHDRTANAIQRQRSRGDATGAERLNLSAAAASEVSDVRVGDARAEDCRSERNVRGRAAVHRQTTACVLERERSRARRVGVRKAIGDDAGRRLAAR